MQDSMQNLDPQSLRGQTLIAITFLQFHCCLDFEGVVSIEVFGSFRCSSPPSTDAAAFSGVPEDFALLLPFIGKEVSDCSIREDEEVHRFCVEFLDSHWIEVGGNGEQRFAGRDSWAWKQGDIEAYFNG